MAPFRWPSIKNDIKLTIEVACHRPDKPADWDAIAETLSSCFSDEEKQIELKGRGCKEKMNRLLKKYQEEDARSLKRSGTEESYDQLHRLLEDIANYRRDMELEKAQEKQAKQEKIDDQKRKGQDMRKAAMTRMSKRSHDNSSSEENEFDYDEDNDDNDNGDDNEANSNSKGKKKTKKRISKLSAIEMLTQKYERKAELKEKELEMRRMELELKSKNQEVEIEERKQRLALEMEERRAMIKLMQNQHTK